MSATSKMQYAMIKPQECASCGEILQGHTGHPSGATYIHKNGQTEAECAKDAAEYRRAFPASMLSRYSSTEAITGLDLKWYKGQMPGSQYDSTGLLVDGLDEAMDKIRTAIKDGVVLIRVERMLIDEECEYCHATLVPSNTVGEDSVHASGITVEQCGQGQTDAQLMISNLKSEVAHLQTQNASWKATADELSAEVRRMQSEHAQDVIASDTYGRSYGFDKGYFVAMQDVMRRMVTFQAYELKVKLSEDDARQMAIFTYPENAINHLLECFFESDDNPGYGQDFDEWMNGVSS